VDDDPNLRGSFEKLLIGEGHEVRTACTGEAGVEAVKAQVPDLVVMDVRMPGMSGLEAFKAMREIRPGLAAVIMTAFGTTDTAIEATRLGAFDYILKPFDIPDILKVIGEALAAGRMARSKVAVGEEGRDQGDAIIGRSPAMQDIYKAIGRVAPTDALVLVRGESGTGKELVARAVYQYSPRAGQPFVIINCVAIPDTLLESELFGYEKGAFTGATHRRVGKIELANRGTVFLDEIGDMPLGVQAKILRLLQEKQVERLGGAAPIPVDVRIIAATNRNLEEAVARGAFREDLYYRLKVVSLDLPPLRERGEDAVLLAETFLSRFCREMGMDNPGLSGEARALILSLPWPGNVRELSNAVQKALIFSRGGPLSAEDIARAAGVDGPGAAGHAPEGGHATAEEALRDWVRLSLFAPGQDRLYESLTDQAGAAIIREALTFTQGNRSRAAKLLGISRPTLIAKIEKYGLRIETQVS
jgi:DNA-binding NtrC family response regulator